MFCCYFLFFFKNVYKVCKSLRITGSFHFCITFAFEEYPILNKRKTLGSLHCLLGRSHAMLAAQHAKNVLYLFVTHTHVYGFRGGICQESHLIFLTPTHIYRTCILSINFTL